MSVVLIALAAFAATLLGGWFALRFRDHLHLVLGFSAGAVAGVAFFDLLPEAVGLGTRFYPAATLAFFAALGFFGYLILDRLVFLHAHDDESNEAGHVVSSQQMGTFGAITLAAHSFIDGVAIGMGWQASPAIGIVVTAAVLTHDFSDGINTVSLVLRSGGDRRQAFRWLLADAVAPVLGAASTLLIRIPESALGLVLAVFFGTFLYLSASDLIPESHHRHPRSLTTVMTLLGALALYVIARVV